MAKVTSKYQVTIPKALADELHIKPGDDIEWSAAGESIRVTPARALSAQQSPASRLEHFDKATARQKRRQASAEPVRTAKRGWTREDLYDRGRTR